MNENDWALTQHPTVERLLKAASQRVAREYEGVVDADDLEQDGRLMVATTSSAAVRRYLHTKDGGENNLYRYLWSRLTDMARKESRRSNRQVPLTRLEAAGL